MLACKYQPRRSKDYPQSKKFDFHDFLFNPEETLLLRLPPRIMEIYTQAICRNLGKAEKIKR